MELCLNIHRLNGENFSVLFAGAMGNVHVMRRSNSEECGTIPQGLSKGCTAIAKFWQRPEATRKGRRRNCMGAFYLFALRDYWNKYCFRYLFDKVV